VGSTRLRCFSSKREMRAPPGSADAKKREFDCFAKSLMTMIGCLPVPPTAQHTGTSVPFRIAFVIGFACLSLPDMTVGSTTLIF
jgi:hypothetical protein